MGHTTWPAWAVSALLFVSPSLAGDVDSLIQLGFEEIVDESPLDWTDPASVFRSDGCDGIRSACQPNPWSFSLTNSIDYGTNLALPISLTPANTLIGPLAGGPVGILNNQLAAALGLLDNLGLSGIPVADVPIRAVFPDDFSTQTRAAASYQRQVSEKGVLTSGYTYYHRFYRNATELNLMQHSITTQYAHSLTDEWTAGVDYGFDYYFLEEDSFVNQNRIGLSLGYRPGSEWYVEASSYYLYANFFNAEFLDSHNNANTLKVIRYLDEEQRAWLTAGYTIGYSDARFNGFSYLVNSAFLGGRWSLDPQAKNQLDATVSYANYHFIGDDPIETDVRRDDSLWTLGLTWFHNFNQNWQAFAAYTFLDSESNVARQQYDSSLFSIGSTWQF